jgi:AcrR family transcriptional regulator
MLHRLFVISVFCVCSALLVSTAQAQVVGQPYRLSDKEVERIIKRIEQQSDRFRSSLDNALDKSRFNGTNREDDINAFIKNYYEQTKRLRDRFDKHQSASADVEAVLNSAARIDDFMTRNRLSSKAEDEWSTLRSNLDELASAYNVNWRWEGYSAAPAIVSPEGTTVAGVPYRVTDREVETILRRIEQQSDRFRSALDASLDRSRFNGTNEEDDINRFVKEFYERTKTLRDHFDDHKSTSADVQAVLDRAASIDSFLRRNRLRNDRAEREWEQLRGNLDELAQVYNVSWEWRY